MKTSTIIGLIIAAPVAIGAYSLFNMVVMKPVALVGKATNTDKMLANYEWFYEASNNYNSRVKQITEFKALLAAETDKGEASRIRIDLSAIKQTCRDLSSKYEAKSGMVHVGFLKSKDLPESLPMKACE